MLVVKVELRSGITGQVSTIAQLRIINDGSGDAEVGNYIVEVMDRTTARVRRRAMVLGHMRRKLSVWKLVAKALAAVGHTVDANLAATLADGSPE